MKEPNYGQMAYGLLEAATALSGILSQSLDGNCIRVNYQFASELVCAMQQAAHAAADELMFIHQEQNDEGRAHG